MPTFGGGELVLIAVFVIAALLHGITGTGFSLIAIGGLSMQFTLTESVLLVLLPTALLNLIAWLCGGGSLWFNLTYYLRRYWLLVSVSLVAAMLGAKLLLWVNQAYLLIALSTVILWYVAAAATGRQFVLPDTQKSMIAVAVAGGIAGGAVNAMSPILMMYLLAVRADKLTVIKVGNVCFFAGKLAQLVVLYPAFDTLSPKMWQLMWLATALAAASVFVGLFLGRFLPQKQFKQLILIVLFLIALKLGIQGVQGI
ncbi:TSUP family transporter [Neisseria animalis]|uniref:Probable membrane transporter protein n=1 Tax=Neisseria animalis TaxID=492 RepID=A0A5P3MR09_NEIAN|nr:TSUP family transporter [Neisseria animalis]QEY24037.1 sulfite exporter TauE/SafE family protein [Neisseria animalis]ROW32605.1 sulfite exporter TauE/SafE family protein [Neisseria animalis]VEE06132.1 putative permease [Neisseria animalis]